ncbi:unnamed protein product, partial [Acanthoscelides obtectus]
VPTSEKEWKKLFKDFQHGEFSGTGRVDTLRPSHRLTGPWMHGQTGTRPDQCKIPSLAPMAHFLIGTEAESATKFLIDVNNILKSQAHLHDTLNSLQTFTVADRGPHRILVLTE